ncbi:MAG: tetratricopeptide repeat protein [Armatimonadetes bacterium]|nr:tetratricopeptide repeat protein [Armatimonadota bacterium]
MKLHCLPLALLAAVTWAADQPGQPAPDPKVQKASDQLDTAAKLLADGKTDEVLALTRQVRRDLGKDAPWLQSQAWMLEGLAQGRAKGWAAAELCFATIADTWPDRPELAEALSSLGVARAEQGKLALARQAYDKLVTACPDSWQSLAADSRLFGLDLREGKLKEAGERVDACLRRFAWYDDGPNMLGRLGQALLDGGQAEPAVARLEQLRGQFPGTQSAYDARRVLVVAYRQLKQTDKALAILDEVVKVTPEMFAVADATDLRASVLADADQWQRAADSLADLAKAYPKTYLAARAMVRRARLLQEHGQTDPAVQTLQQLYDDFPGPLWRVQTLTVTFDLLRDAKRYDAAEDAALKLIDLTQGSPVASNTMLELARVQWDAGRKKSARQTAQKVFQTCKGAPVVQIAESPLAEWEGQGE